MGVLLMAVAMFLIPLVDGLAKHLSASYSPLFLGWARYAAASILVVPLAARRHGRQIFPRERLWSHVLRTALLVGAMTVYFLAVARLPLATAASGYLVGPIVAVVLSVALLGERITAARSAGLALGVAGSLVVLQPGDSFDPGLLLALGAGALFGVYLVATRLAALASNPVQTLAFQCVAGTLLLTPQALGSWRTPVVGDLPLFAALGVLSALSHVLSIAAFRRSAASTLAPLVYLELVGATLTGYIVFNETPGTSTVAGTILIVMAGLILAGRGRWKGSAQPWDGKRQTLAADI
jgi:drug/metabolite transporter (DMT)-like permease